MSNSTPWTSRGIAIVTEDNIFQQSLYNLAYLLETNLQVTGTDISFKYRTSSQNKLVFTSYPQVNPIRPTIIVERVNLSGDPMGKNSDNISQSFQIKVVGNKPVDVDKLLTHVFKTLRNAKETLHAYNLHFDPVDFIAHVPTQPDPELAKTFFGAMIFSFFSIIC
jgi:hypothetical protein